MEKEVSAEWVFTGSEKVIMTSLNIDMESPWGDPVAEGPVESQTRFISSNAVLPALSLTISLRTYVPGTFALTVVFRMNRSLHVTVPVEGADCTIHVMFSIPEPKSDAVGYNVTSTLV